MEHLELLVVERSLEPDYARELLNQLAATEAYRLSDYESARQVALAAQALAQPLKSRPRLQAIVPSLGQSILLPLPGQPQAELVPSYSKRYLELQAQYDPAAFAHRVAELRNAIK